MPWKTRVRVLKLRLPKGYTHALLPHGATTLPDIPYVIATRRGNEIRVEVPIRTYRKPVK